MAEIRIVIPGKPQAKQRPRFARCGKFVKTYTPEATRNAELNMSEIATRQAREQGWNLSLAALFCMVNAYVAIPASKSKIWRLKALQGEIRPITKSDLDNYIKTVDALNKILFKDDSQIVDIQAGKYYSSNPRLEITIREILNG